MLRGAARAHKSPGQHATEIEPPCEMIDFVLNDARVPASSVALKRLSRAIERPHAHAAGPGHDRPIPIDAQAPFEELCGTIIEDCHHGIDQYSTPDSVDDRAGPPLMPIRPHSRPQQSCPRV